MMYAADFRRIARESLKGRWPLAIVATLVAGFFGGVPGSSGSINLNLDESTMSMLYDLSPQIIIVLMRVIEVFAIWSVICFVIGGAVKLGYCLLSLDYTDKRDTSFGVIFSQFPRIWDGICLNFLTFLYTFLWTLLFIIPGIIAGYSYAMAPYVMAEDPNCGANEALRRSKEMMRGNRFRLFCLELSFIGWSFLCVFTLGIGYLWLAPYTYVSRAAFYREISGTWPAARDASQGETYTYTEY